MLGQLTATKRLCHLYGYESPDQAQCIIYSQHQVLLLRRCGDRGQEGDALEAVSRLYLTVATERCCSVGTLTSLAFHPAPTPTQQNSFFLYFDFIETIH